MMNRSEQSDDIARYFELESISLFETTAIRYEEVPRTRKMGVVVSIENENGEIIDGQVECRSICSVTIRNESEEDNPREFALFISHYRPVFEVSTDFQEDGSSLDVSEGTTIGDALSEEVLRVVYPYHRQLVVDLMSRMNLPVFLLPTLSEHKARLARAAQAE